MSKAVRFALAAACCLAAASPLAAQDRAQGAATTGPIEIGGVNDSHCAITVGDPSIGAAQGRYSAMLAISIACNTGFAIHAAAAEGVFQAFTPQTAPGGAMPVPYDVQWPASLVDASGSPIAPQFSTTGDQWRAGIAALSGPTGTAQLGTMVVRLRETLPEGSQVFPDTFTFQIEQN